MPPIPLLRDRCNAVDNCKSLVGARCKLSGMRNWQYGNAEAVLALRAARQDGEFSALWSAHLYQAP